VLFNHFNTVNTTPLLTIVAKNNFLLPSGLYITKYSAQIVALTILRSGCSLSIVYVLLTTTSWSKIAHGLAWLKFPCSFILILEMTYRYIFLLANLALQLNQARLLRSVGIITHQNNRKFIGHSIAVLFLKAHYLANEIFQAMRCRGFSAYQNPVVDQLSYRDYQFMVFNFSFIIGIFLLG
jgi:cobalt/nickel transport system permease protein